MCYYLSGITVRTHGKTSFVGFTLGSREPRVASGKLRRGNYPAHWLLLELRLQCGDVVTFLDVHAAT